MHAGSPFHEQATAVSGGVDCGTAERLPKIIDELIEDSQIWPDEAIQLRNRLAEANGLNPLEVFFGVDSTISDTVRDPQLDYVVATILEIAQLFAFGGLSLEYSMKRNSRWKLKSERFVDVPPLPVRAQLAFNDTVLSHVVAHRWDIDRL